MIVVERKPRRYKRVSQARSLREVTIKIELTVTASNLNRKTLRPKYQSTSLKIM